MVGSIWNDVFEWMRVLLVIDVFVGFYYLVIVRLF